MMRLVMEQTLVNNGHRLSKAVDKMDDIELMLRYTIWQHMAEMTQREEAIRIQQMRMQ